MSLSLEAGPEALGLGPGHGEKHQGSRPPALTAKVPPHPATHTFPQFPLSLKALHN